VQIDLWADGTGKATFAQIVRGMSNRARRSRLRRDRQFHTGGSFGIVVKKGSTGGNINVTPRNAAALGHPKKASVV
jgi:hypothetical protein